MLLHFHKIKKNKGQALVEFVIIFPIFIFLFIFGAQVFTGIYQATGKQEQAKQRFLTTQVNNQGNNAAMMSAGVQVEQTVSTERIQTAGVPFLGQASGNTSRIPVRIGICRTVACGK